MVVVVIALSATEAAAEGAEVVEMEEAEVQKWVYVPDDPTPGNAPSSTHLTQAYLFGPCNSIVSFSGASVCGQGCKRVWPWEQQPRCV